MRRVRQGIELKPVSAEPPAGAHWDKKLRLRVLQQGFHECGIPEGAPEGAHEGEAVSMYDMQQVFLAEDFADRSHAVPCRRQAVQMLL